MRTNNSNWTNGSSFALQGFDFIFDHLTEHCILNSVQSMFPECRNDVVDTESGLA